MEDEKEDKRSPGDFAVYGVKILEVIADGWLSHKELQGHHDKDSRFQILLDGFEKLVDIFDNVMK